MFQFTPAHHVVDPRYEEKIPGDRTVLRGVFPANFRGFFRKTAEPILPCAKGLKLLK
jgi:hypothetical protein